ncbi:MAG: 30S ribosomal protein S27e [Promethearchaeota archaeon]|nr:MAG: 30S ribosomal protein S27e [Candidatus Lokiarchaeota archaeon]
MQDEFFIPQPKSRFLKVKCLDCGNEQIIFGCASTTVKCLICSKVLAIPKASKAEVKTKILTVLG